MGGVIKRVQADGINNVNHVAGTILITLHVVINLQNTPMMFALLSSLYWSNRSLKSLSSSPTMNSWPVAELGLNPDGPAGGCTQLLPGEAASASSAWVMAPCSIASPPWTQPPLCQRVELLSMTMVTAFSHRTVLQPTSYHSISLPLPLTRALIIEMEFLMDQLRFNARKFYQCYH